MTAPPPAHRMTPERGPVQAVTRLLLGQLLAVIGIAAAIAAVAIAIGPDRNDKISAAVPTQHSSTPAASTASASTSSAPAPEPTPSPATTGAVPGPVDVDVLNQSAPSGDAGRVAHRLRDAGWSIGRVEDFHGNVRETTVYWLDREQRRQARQISRFLGGIRVQQGFDTLVEGRVSVILVGRD